MARYSKENQPWKRKPWNSDLFNYFPSKTGLSIVLLCQVEGCGALHPVDNYRDWRCCPLG
eukprot:628276-Amphidinium_carterae.1